MIAVAIAESVLFYRHLKPYFKYTIPASDADELELEVWRKLPVMKPEAHDGLLQLLKDVDHAKLSRKTQRLLQLSEDERAVSQVPYKCNHIYPSLYHFRHLSAPTRIRPWAARAILWPCVA